MKPLADALVITWIALLGADRVDFLGGDGPFVLTPFLLLTPFVVASEVMRRWRTGTPLTISRSGIWFLGLACLLLSLIAGSVLGSRDTATSAARAVLLTVQVGSAIVVVLLLGSDDRARRLLARGGAAAIAVFLAFDVSEFFAWLAGVTEPVRLGSLSLRVAPFTYASFLPRLSGPVFDPNRSALVLLASAYLVAVARPTDIRRGPWLLLTIPLLLASVSRSGAIAALVTAAVWVWDRRSTRVPLRGALTAAIAGVAATVLLLASAGIRDFLAYRLTPLLQRLSLAEGSSQHHLMLFGRGLDVATASVAQAMFGIGYGNSYLVLQDFFPGNRYGNFHSLYVTVFTEAGAFAWLVTLAMLGVPLARRAPYRAVLAGAAFFSVFYQAQTDPAFWLVLTLGWMTLARRLAPDPARG